MYYREFVISNKSQGIIVNFHYSDFFQTTSDESPLITIGESHSRSSHTYSNNNIIKVHALMVNKKKDSYVIINIMLKLIYDLHVCFEYNVKINRYLCD